ncbi:MAG: DNA-binding protein [Lacrimispora sp.]|uniref:DNA-binding protein n=1 Tax=Lacrimispora sp. TaxID=2719234 RepID=UPI0039E7020C
MYPNLLTAMKVKGITFAQIADLLGYRHQTISENFQENTEKGIYFDDAQKIWKVFFPEYDFIWLFRRTKDESQ